MPPLRSPETNRSHVRRVRLRPRLFAHSLPAEDRLSHARGPAAEGAGNSGALGAGEPVRGASPEWEGSAQIRPPRWSSLRQRQCPHRHGAQQDAEGHCRPFASDDGAGIQLRARLGLPRAADRMEGRGGILPKQGQGEARLLGFASHHRLPQGMPRLRRTLALGAAGRIQAARRRRRLGSSLHDDELSSRSADRSRNLQVRRQRAALSRLETGDVERRREDGACRG